MCTRRISIFLIAVALIIGVVSCNGGGVTEYNLIMAVAPPGSGMATDETCTLPYSEGTVVNITAVAAPCYRFVDWTTPTGTFGDPGAETTTFTMPAQDVTVTANFELTPPDHFKFYDVDYDTAPYVGKDVQLVDQFGAINATVGYVLSFGNPVEKTHNDTVMSISDANRHYTLYSLSYEGEPQSWRVVVTSQFGNNQELTVYGPTALAVPTQKESHSAPVCLNHFLVYGVEYYGTFPEVGVHLKDQFTEEDVVIREPVAFANPVQKTIDGEVTDIEKEDEHLLFYYIEGASFSETVQIDNQFGPQTLNLEYPELLAVPSEKVSWEQPLDHFKCYYADGVSLEEDVQLVDQFGAINATLMEPFLFGNPTQKLHGDLLTPISNPNNHLTLYSLNYETTSQVWQVTVDNQFGNNQVLTVAGPFWLAVPTQKGLQDAPVDLDHFLVYQVLDRESYSMSLYLEDQFTSGTTNVSYAALFANPVEKTHGPHATPIKNEDEHLVFYWIGGGDFIAPELSIDNQFGPQILYVYEDLENMLAVPSLKVEWSLVPP
jgi:hypothetical protein